ncbi:unnamed protein product [Discosporangium mesarthrocarpum]
MGFVVPALVTALGIFLGVFYPRAPTWQITSMKYKSVSANLDLTADVKIDMGLEVFNPNYVSATLNSIQMVLFHDDLSGREAAFGVISVPGGGGVELPARGSRIVDSQLLVDDMPMSMGIQMGREVQRNNGTLVSHSFATMHVTVLSRPISIEADCVQHMRADLFPIKITKIDCKYYFKKVWVPMLP